MLAHLAYADPALRSFGDVDVLVGGASFDAAVRCSCPARLPAAFRRTTPGFRRPLRQGRVSRAARRYGGRPASHPGARRVRDPARAASTCFAARPARSARVAFDRGPRRRDRVRPRLLPRRARQSPAPAGTAARHRRSCTRRARHRCGRRDVRVGPVRERVPAGRSTSLPRSSGCTSKGRSRRGPRRSARRGSTVGRCRVTRATTARTRVRSRRRSGRFRRYATASPTPPRSRSRPGSTHVPTTAGYARRITRGLRVLKESVYPVRTKRSAAEPEGAIQ